MRISDETWERLVEIASAAAAKMESYGLVEEAKQTRLMIINEEKIASMEDDLELLKINRKIHRRRQLEEKNEGIEPTAADYHRAFCPECARRAKEE